MAKIERHFGQAVLCAMAVGVHQALVQGPQAQHCRSLPVRLIVACNSLIIIIVLLPIYFLGEYE